LFFCGSIGGGFHDGAEVLKNARRLWRELRGDTVVAPGHGPLTTIETEREFNPFSDSG
jgi:glyoxylase-like metal-dependent hydrolase (beta-lactamase superfamily II)